MQIQYVLKRNGELEKFDINKILRWELWACDGFKDKIDWRDIIIKVKDNLFDKMSTQEIQLKLIEECNTRSTWLHSIVAGRLYSAYITKKIFPNSIPTVKEHHLDLQSKGLMNKLDYTDEEYETIEKFIDHSRDFTLSYGQLLQIINKYGLSNRVTKDRYETPQFVFMRMAMALSEDEGESKLEKVEKFYNFFSKFKINAPSPNYTNLGTNHNGYISCCLYTVKDTAESLAAGDHIAYTMTYMSAGIGGFLNVRSINDTIKDGFIRHMGKLPYFKSVAAAVNAMTQGGRGGACTQYFSCYDPEVISIIYLQNPRTPISKQNRDLHFAMQFNSLFVEKVYKNENIFTFNAYTAPDLMNAFFSGNKELFKEIYNRYENDDSFIKNYIPAREIALAAIKQAHEVATLYLFNVDEANTHTPFKDSIYQSNLCVAPETKILTKEYGYVPVASLKDREISVWNGEQWSKTTVIKTGENQKLLSVVTDSGSFIDATPYHKWYIQEQDKHDGTSKIIEKRTSELNPGDNLISFSLDVVEHGTLELEADYKQNIVNKKFFIPNREYTLESRLKWLSDLFDSDGCLTINNGCKSIQLASTNYDFLVRLRLMLQELGILSTISDASDSGYRLLPNHKDGSKEYYCNKIWKILISNDNVLKLKTLGLNTYRLYLSDIKQDNREVNKSVKIVEVLDKGRYDDTYCVNEPLKHMVMFEGVLTGNCLEIDQPTIPYSTVKDLYTTEEHDRGEISLCALGGIAPSFIESDEEYEEVAYYTLLMIDKCIHKNKYVFPHLKYTALSRLNAGVGIIGLAYELAKNGYNYTSEESLKYIHYIAERHMYYLIKASLRLGKERGNAKWMHKTKWPTGWLPIDTYNKNIDTISNFGYKYDWEKLRLEIIENKGIRNSVLVAHMPTESSSKVTGLPNGIYPIRDIYLKKTDASMAIDTIARDSDFLKDDYQLAWELTPKDLCKFYGIVQKFTDNGISADFYSNREKEPTLKTSRLYDELFYMYKYGLKSRYYTNSKTTKSIKLENLDSEKGCSGGFCTL